MTAREEMAMGYAEAALFTNDEGAGPGEYQADAAHVASLMPLALVEVDRFGEALGYGVLGSLPMEFERIGNCLHYAREGHGVTFTDDVTGTHIDGDDDALNLAQDVARSMGADDRFTEAVWELVGYPYGDDDE